MEGTEKGPGEAGVGSTVAGLARQYLSSGKMNMRCILKHRLGKHSTQPPTPSLPAEEPGHEAGTGDKQAGGTLGAMAMGAAQTWLGGGGGGGAVRGETAEGGAGQADVGLVDELLGLYQQTQGKRWVLLFTWLWGGEGPAFVAPGGRYCSRWTCCCHQHTPCLAPPAPCTHQLWRTGARIRQTRRPG